MGIWDRRRVLSVAAGMTLSGSALTGCGLFDSDPDPIPAPDPMQPVLDEARALAAMCDRLAVAQPEQAARLTPLGDDHRAHAAELGRLIGAADPSASAPGASAPATAGDVGALRTAVQAAQRTAVAAARAAPADRVALLGSIAACRAAQVEALR